MCGFLNCILGISVKLMIGNCIQEFVHRPIRLILEQQICKNDFSFSKVKSLIKSMMRDKYNSH